MLTHKSVWDALDALAARYDLSVSGLARKAGLDPTSFNKSKRFSPDGRERWPSTESVAKALEATGASIDEFAALTHSGGNPAAPAKPFNYPPRMQAIPLIGHDQASGNGFFDDNGFPVGQDWDVIEFPLGSEKPTCYAIEIRGDGLAPLYRDGDRLIVEPGSQVRRGDRVLLRLRSDEVVVGVLARKTARIAEVENGAGGHAPRLIELADIAWVARVIWASQ